MFDSSLLAHGDIFLHVGVSAVLTLFFLISFRKAPRKQAILLTIFLVIGIGLGKEFYDVYFSAKLDSPFSIKDMLSNYAGLTLGILTLS